MKPSVACVFSAAFCAGLLMVTAPALAQPKGLDPIAPDVMPPIPHFPGMSDEQLKIILAETMKVQNCIANEAKEPLARLQKQNEINSRKIDALCQTGKRDEAEALAILQAKEVAESDDMKMVRKCSETDFVKRVREKDAQRKKSNPKPAAVAKKKHVCDYMKNKAQ